MPSGKTENCDVFLFNDLIILVGAPSRSAVHDLVSTMAPRLRVRKMEKGNEKKWRERAPMIKVRKKEKDGEEGMKWKKKEKKKERKGASVCVELPVRKKQKHGEKGMKRNEEEVIMKEQKEWWSFIYFFFL